MAISDEEMVPLVAYPALTALLGRMGARGLVRSGAAGRVAGFVAKTPFLPKSLLARAGASGARFAEGTTRAADLIRKATMGGAAAGLPLSIHHALKLHEREMAKGASTVKRPLDMVTKEIIENIMKRGKLPHIGGGRASKAKIMSAMGAAAPFVPPVLAAGGGALGTHLLFKNLFDLYAEDDVRTREEGAVRISADDKPVSSGYIPPFGSPLGRR